MQQGRGPRPFDVTPRSLIEGDPESWLSWVGLPVNGPVHAIDTHLSTVLAEVDKVLRVDAPSPWLAHFELQANRDRRLPFRLLQYHALLLHGHELPVDSTVVLLRPAADGPEMSGRLEQYGPAGSLTIAFAFRVVRLWERPVEELLSGGLGVLPLAPLAAVEPAQLPDVMRRLGERFGREVDTVGATDLRAATQLLLGLRYDDEQIRELVPAMSAWWRESSIYQATLREGLSQGLSQGLAEGRAAGLAEGLAEGRAIEARRLVLALGAEKFGPPPASIVLALEDLSVDALERLIRRTLTASTWSEVMEAETRP